jgi:hypothetical protein
VYRFIRSFVLGLPAFVFLCAFIPFIPGATGMFSDSPGPWYQPVTARLFLAALFYSYPVTFICTSIRDEMFFSPGYYLVLAGYTLFWILFFRSIVRFFEHRAKKTS